MPVNLNNPHFFSSQEKKKKPSGPIAAPPVPEPIKNAALSVLGRLFKRAGQKLKYTLNAADTSNRASQQMEIEPGVDDPTSSPAGIKTLLSRQPNRPPKP